MNNRIDAIYARQSVDKKDSISIESQIEFCKYELKGGNCKEYTDKGYSGKNTDRPKFQELVRDIKRGLDCKGRGLQARPYQPFHSGLCQHDGAVPAVQCGVCVLYGKV